MRQPLLGVLGGMGPLATAHFYRTLVELTPAALDQDHLPVVIWADPSVPDRTRALVGHGPSPLPSLLKGLRHLERAGASLIVIPCNTAHAYLGALRAAADVEILDMPSQVLAQAEPYARRTGRIGLLATRGTRYAGVYEQAARTRGVTIHNVSQATQTNIVDRAIAAVKSGSDLAAARRAVALAARELVREGVEVVVAGCTEIPLIASQAREFVPVVDSTASLARAAIDAMNRQLALARTGHRRGAPLSGAVDQRHPGPDGAVGELVADGDQSQ